MFSIELVETVLYKKKNLNYSKKIYAINTDKVVRRSTVNDRKLTTEVVASTPDVVFAGSMPTSYAHTRIPNEPPACASKLTVTR